MPYLKSISLSLENCDQLIIFLEKNYLEGDTYNWSNQIIQVIKNTIKNKYENDPITITLDGLLLTELIDALSNEISKIQFIDYPERNSKENQEQQEWVGNLLGTINNGTRINRWDYLFIGRISADGKMKVLEPSAYRITANGFELITDFKNRPKGISDADAMGSFIAQLGEEGWELTGVAQIDAWHNLYFKRPKP